ncbi:hypothetical protein MCEGE14_02530 [Burkholderiaceae bacterium]
MTTNPNNPFVLPGLGQTGEMGSNPLFASLEMMRQTFSALSGTNGLAKGLAMQATLDPAELEKKINELKSVESWLKLNLSMLSSTIQGMEVQLATITTLQQFMSANRDNAQSSWQHVPSTAPAQTSTPEPQIPPAAKLKTPDVSNTEGAQAWWNMLTQQFGQLAAATTASMPAALGAKTAARPRSNTKKTVTRSPAKK